MWERSRWNSLTIFPRRHHEKQSTNELSHFIVIVLRKDTIISLNS